MKLDDLNSANKYLQKALELNKDKFQLYIKLIKL